MTDRIAEQDSLEGLIARLRVAKPNTNHNANAGLCHEAADTLSQMRDALGEIAKYTGEGPPTTPWKAIVKDLSVIARAALAATTKIEKE